LKVQGRTPGPKKKKETTDKNSMVNGPSTVDDPNQTLKK